MGNHNRRRPLSKAALLYMATTASALSLSNFQLITSAQVPLGCILTYNRQIPFCTNADFTRGNGCSSDCADAIDRLQYMLQNVCGDGDGTSSSILAQAMQGTLVDVLCPASAGGGGGLQPPATTTTSVGKLTLTTVVPPRTTFTTESTSSSISSSTSSSSTTTETPRASDIPEPGTSQAVPPPQETSTAVPSQTTSGQQQATPPAAPPNTNFGGVGGGSPFDEPILNASPRLDTGWMAISLSALVMGIVLGV